MNDNRQIANKVATKTGLFLLVLVGIVAFYSSCQKDKRRENAAKIVAEWTGKKILFPAGIPCQSLGIDTTCIDCSNQTYKILLYVDSVGCSSCRLKLYEWKQIMEEADELFPVQVDFLFFFQPKKQDEKELQLLFRQYSFRHPVFIDSANEINQLNKFPSNINYQCFLLDSANKVLLIGNPIYNPGIWQLFKKYILERESKLTSGKREESITHSNLMTLSPASPSNKKGGDKGTELI